MNPLEMIQLPDDVVGQGYRETRPFHHEQVFHSPSRNFTGTAEEFVTAGHAYAYIEIDKFRRRITRGSEPVMAPPADEAETCSPPAP